MQKTKVTITVSELVDKYESLLPEIPELFDTDEEFSESLHTGTAIDVQCMKEYFAEREEFEICARIKKCYETNQD